MRPTAALPLALLLALSAAPPLSAQWTNRYPRVEGFSHHVYLEGYELPALNAGILDPAPSPDGRSLAFASRGWLWLLDLGTGEARRLTRGGGIDARPAWSPDGRSLAFVRDDTRETSIVVLDVAAGAERVVAAEPTLELDPVFTADGRALLLSSGKAGDLDLWRLDLDGGAWTRLTEQRGLELRPQAHPDGRRVLYLSKAGGADEIRIRALEGGSERVLRAGSIVSQSRPALSPDGRTVAFNWPVDDGWELRLMDVEEPGPTVLLTRGRGNPLTPAWSADGRTVYYVEASDDERMELRRIPAGGGRPVEVAVTRWSWGEETARLRIVTRLAGEAGAGPARLSVRDGAGHPVVPDRAPAWFDGQNGRVFFYSPGTIEVTVPAGEVEVEAVRGLATPARVARQRVAAGGTAEVEIALEPVWDARAGGWLSGDHHFHLNYGGPYRLAPTDLVLPARGEALDVATPLVANLHNRYVDDELWGWSRTDSLPWIDFGQEVRPHFLGHTGHLGTDTLFHPWIWGPGYQVWGRDDRPSAEALLHTRRQGGVNVYVHPVMRPEPFGAGGVSLIPVGLIPDAVLGAVDALEVVCLWSDELGTSEVWYRFLNLGIPVAPSAGTDVMTDFYRTMAIGTTRVYVRPESAGYRAYLAGLKAGRSFVTNGPLLDFRVGEARPGEAVGAGGGRASWRLELASAVPVERVEVLVNGVVAWSGRGLDAPGRRTLSGSVRLPAGGWVAARAVGGRIASWPAMDSYAFAHTAPVWIGRVGSVDPEAERRAARELLGALDDAERRLEAGYAGTDIPVLREHFRRARQELERRAGR